ncbi:TetR/AcrR family transcriptional regulator [Paenibacillus albiflavus]|uniref:TetR/AcrR family transcriptional regulator n=1 Tax=Paenibacillus albiflavus TaxID=2545760 RepID=A0A4R4E4L7_9BACL|nr:TetR/AcrR family transcriptional regulator [Paenibacillus albiflavus]TCZ73793.1 TetR/AcrR family transcriptional regulator [Paenibacillus albiflavus]
MDQEKMDRRIAKTRIAIKNVFTELIDEIGFDAVTVKNITDKANINRSTFYLHYRDKYDLLEKSEEEIIQKIEEISKSIRRLTPKELNNLYSDNKPFPFVIKLAEYFRDNAAFLKVILGPKGDLSFQEKIKTILEKNIVENVRAIFGEGTFHVPIDVFMAYIISAHVGSILHWLNTGMKQSPEEIATIIFNLTFQGPVNAIGFKKFQ